MTSHGIGYPIGLASLGQPNRLLVKIIPIPAEPRTHVTGQRKRLVLPVIWDLKMMAICSHYLVCFKILLCGAAQP